MIVCCEPPVEAPVEGVFSYRSTELLSGEASSPSIVTDLYTDYNTRSVYAIFTSKASTPLVEYRRLAYCSPMSSTAVILVLVISFMIGRCDAISLQAVAGSMLVALGAFFLAMRYCGEVRPRKTPILLSVLMGVMIYATYGLVLTSLAYVNDVSYAVAFRQISLPIGVLLGLFILREGGGWLRFSAVLVMVAGLISVATRVEIIVSA